MEQALIAQNWPRLTIVRPSMLLGDRDKQRTNEMFLAPLFRLLPGNWKSIEARDVARAMLPGGKLELIEGNHNPGMNIVQAPAKHGVHDKFAHMLLDFYGDPAQYAYETVKQP